MSNPRMHVVLLNLDCRVALASLASLCDPWKGACQGRPERGSCADDCWVCNLSVDRTISQVVEGSHMAESAGEQMTANREMTAKLVSYVSEIAIGSEAQSRIGSDLRIRADGMLDRTRETAGEVTDQVEQTKNLVRYARMLLQSVRAFKLPERSEREAA